MATNRSHQLCALHSSQPSLRSTRQRPVRRTVPEVLHDALIEQGVEVMFGYPGGAILPTFDALYKTPVKFILTRHEQGAGHMADGYARATGKVGTAIVTSGPGATNLTTALATAYMDSIPMVAFTGQVATAAIGNDAFQEADVAGITRPVTKYNVLVKDVSDLPRVIREAFHIARTGRPGPVLVDLPKDVQVGTCPTDDRRRAEPARLSPAGARATSGRSGWRPRRSTRPSGRCSTSAAA